jgi:hypothetical protein
VWDVLTGKPLGPVLRSAAGFTGGDLSPDGRLGLVVGRDELVRFLEVPTPLEGDARRLTLWAQVLTGMELDGQGGLRLLDGATWRDRSRRLRELPER